MTNEKFEQILRRALAPDIDDHEIFVQYELSDETNGTVDNDTERTYIITNEKARSNCMKIIANIAAAAACVALVAGIGIGGKELLQHRTQAVEGSGASSVVSNVEKSTVWKLGEKEFAPGDSIPLTYDDYEKIIMLNEENGQGTYIITNSYPCGFELTPDIKNYNVKYAIAADFNCDGEGIESVTYSINKGAFAIITVEESDSPIKSGTLYDGEPHFTTDVKRHKTEKRDSANVIIRGLGGVPEYYTEYTVDYDSQRNGNLCVDICGEVFDEDIYYKIYNNLKNSGVNDPETKAEGLSDLMKGVEITCTVNYTDGTKESKKLTLEGVTMTSKELGRNSTANNYDPDKVEATFAYKFN